MTGLSTKKTSLTPRQFQKILFTWFDQHGRKNLPWQQNKTPYRVWVSEIMLQQTQVTTAIPYYQRFMERFPNVSALAEAPQDEVLHAWAGLGYYTRARNLHAAARKIQADYQGRFPNELASIMELPGIGRSTAGAILSIAFKQPAAILDGNVKRVLTRLHGITEPVNTKSVETRLWEIAEKYTPLKRVDDYTQAIMDLGATFCTRSKPQCKTCPFAKSCLGFLHDIAETLPNKNKASPLPIREKTFLIIQKDNAVYLQKKPMNGIWGGLWSLPELPGQPDDTLIQTFLKKQFQTNLNRYQTLPSFRHTFSHYHLTIHPIVISIKRLPLKINEPDSKMWYKLHQPNKIGLPKPIQILLKALT